ncbi:MAG: TatD family hydrolase [Culturomica sp.]|jgi:TatD DNase family protein|nr:TatD family hydrolase [Culturomica sp.]
MKTATDIHTHTPAPGHCTAVLDISDGKPRVPGMLYSKGIHPLFFRGEEELREIETEAAGGVLAAIGECGMDRNAPVCLKKQEYFFSRQVELSEKYRLPLIIHCVRAFPELLSVHKNMRPSESWIIHGYNNNREILEALLRQGLCVSAGKHILDPVSNIRQWVSLVPADRLFLETDDSGFPLEKIYGETARLRGETVERLTEHVWVNFRRTFHDKK